MSQDWASQEIAFFDKTVGKGAPNFPFQEWAIAFIASLIDGSTAPINQTTTDEIATKMLDPGTSIKDAWYEFTRLIFSAAGSTASGIVHERLVALVFAFTNHVAQEDASVERKEVDDIFKNLTQFGWVVKELWNGPETHKFDTPEEAQRSWVNMNRFLAHLSRQQRRTPVEPFEDNDYLEDFGLWNISDGLEEENGTRTNGETAAVWFIVAGEDIYGDATWGKRDGKPREGMLLRQGVLWDGELEKGADYGMRWGFWRKRLLVIADDQSLGVSVRDTARQAEQVMGEIESAS